MAKKNQKINVQMIIDTKFENAQKNIKAIADQLNNIKLPEAKKDNYKKVTDALDKIAGKFETLQNFNLKTSNFDSYEKKILSVGQAFDKVNEKILKIKNDLNNSIAANINKKNSLISQIESLTGKTFNRNQTGRQAGLISDEDLKKYKTLKSEITKIDTSLRNLGNEKNFFDALTLNTENYSDVLKKLNQNLDSARDQIKNFDDEAAAEGVRSLVKQFINFYVVLETTKRIIGDAYQTIRQLDEGLTSIAAVSGKTREQMWGMVGDFNQMAQRLGTTTQQVVEASKLYYQQGRTQSEVMYLVEQTAILATTAEIDYATATDYLTAAINGYNIAASEAYTVTDSWSALAAASAVDVNELAVAMSKVASLAAASGLELETASAFLSKMLETTREAPENLGTALKTIISRFQDLKMSEEELEDGVSANDVETALASAGIALRDESGQFRDFDDVLLELSSVWDSLSINTQKYIATIAAGSRQQSRFIALVEDYERNLELIDIAQDSAGASLSQFSTQITGLQASLNRVTAAWEGFYTSFSQGPSLISGLLNILAGFINTITLLGPAGTGAAATITALTVAIAGFSAASLIADKSTLESIKSIKELGGSAKDATVQVVKMGIQKTKDMALNAGMIVGYGAVVVAIMAAIGAIAYFVTAKKREIKAVEQSIQTHKEEEAKYQSTARSAQSLLDEYKKLYQQGEDLTEIKQKIIDQFSGEIKGIETAVNSYNTLNEVLEEYIKNQNILAGQAAYERYGAERKRGYIQNEDDRNTQEAMLGSIFQEYVYDERTGEQKSRWSFKNPLTSELIENFNKQEIIDYVKENFPAKDYVDTISQTEAEMMEDYFKETEGYDISSQALQLLSLDSSAWKETKEGSELTPEAKERGEAYQKSLNDYLKTLSEEDSQLFQEYLNQDFANISEALANKFSETLNSIDPSKNFGDSLQNLYLSELENLNTVLQEAGIDSTIADNFSPIVKRMVAKALESAEDDPELKELIATTYKNIFAIDPGIIGDFDLGTALSNLDLTDASAVSDLGIEILKLGQNTDLTSEETNKLILVYKQLLPFMAQVTEGFESISQASNDYYKLKDQAKNAVQSDEGLSAADFAMMAQEAKNYGLSLEYGINAQGKFVVSEQSLIALMEEKRKATIAELKVQRENEYLKLQQMEAAYEQQQATAGEIEASKKNVEATTFLAQAKGMLVNIMDLLTGGSGAVANALINEAKALSLEAQNLESSNEITLDMIQAQKEVVEAHDAQIVALENENIQYELNEAATGGSTSATEDNTSALDAQKEALEANKDALQDQVDALEKQKEALEEARDAAKDYVDTLADAIQNKLEDELDKAESAVENYYEALNDALDELISNAEDKLDDLNEAATNAKNLAEENSEALQEQADLVIEFYDSQIQAIQDKIDAMDAEADSLDRLQKLQEARDAYEQAKQKTRLVLIEGAGWRFRTDKNALQEAGETLATTETENQVELLEQQIEQLENIKNKWEEIAENIGKATSELEKTAAFKQFLSNASPEQLDQLYNQFTGNVNQNNTLFENALQAQNRYELENDASAEGTLAWQIAQWQAAQEQAALDQNQYDILTDPNAKAVEELKQQLLEQLGSASEGSINDALAAGLEIITENAEKVNAINDTLTALEELLTKMDMTSEEIAQYDAIQNMVGQASLDALLEGGSVYNKLKDQVNEIVRLNDQIYLIDQQIEVLEGQIEIIEGQINALSSQINSVKDSIDDGFDRVETAFRTYADATEEKIESAKKQWDWLIDNNSPVQKPFGQAALGGVDDQSGYLKVHGTQNRPELILNNSQSAGLFNFIDSLTRLPTLTSLDNFGMSQGNSYNSTYENGLSFSNCTFEISTNADNFENLILDIKRQAHFK